MTDVNLRSLTVNDSSTIEIFLQQQAPFGMDPADKAVYLKDRLSQLQQHHKERCQGYAALLSDWKRYSLSEEDDFMTRYPYFPVSLFKEYELRSSTGELTVIESSATTSKNASKIYVDKQSRKRQSRSANLILSDFIGAERRPYIVFDLEETVRGSKAFGARAAAIMALAHMASEFHFVMKQTKDGLRIDKEKLRSALDRIGHSPFIAYGFTFILFQAHQELNFLPQFKAHPECVFLHSGGWKKLTELAVDKHEFNKTVALPWGIAPERVIDFYGTIEQVGMAYPDCNEGLKHVPYWAEVITRRADSLTRAAVGESGLIQLISCLPLSSPNHSVLTEDLGTIVLDDGCGCGRRGCAFIFEGRAPRSELRGCSDVVRR